MDSGVRCGVVLLLATIGVGAQGTEVRASVDRVLEEWGRRPARSPKLVAAELVALGPEVAEYGALLLPALRGTRPVTPLALALGAIGGKNARDALATLLRSKQPGDRAAAVGGLGRMPSTFTARLLVRALEDPDPRVRRAATRELSTPAWRDAKWGVNATVAARIPGASVKGDLALFLAHRRAKGARKLFRRLVQRRDAASQLAGLRALSVLGLGDDAALVTRRLSRLRPEARAEACVVLGRVRYRPAVPDLIGLLRDPDPRVRGPAHRALRTVTGQRFDNHADLWESWWKTASAGNR